MHPDEIIALFKAHWSGTAEELSTTIDAFYHDIRSTVELALDAPPIPDNPHFNRRVVTLNTMDDYYANHYGEEEFA